MGDTEDIEDISPLVRRWMPNASDEELRAATDNFRRYLEVLYEIYQRLEQEGKFPLRRDRDQGARADRIA